MHLITNSKFISFLWWIFAPILVAMLINSAAVLMLDNAKITALQTSLTTMRSIRSFPLFLHTDRSQDEEALSQIKPMDLLAHITLLACYSESVKKFIVFQEGSRTIFLDLNQNYKNAKLVQVGNDYAVFVENGKRVTLMFEKIKAQGAPQAIVASSSQSGNRYVDVRRDDFKKYTDNVSTALRDIRFQVFKEQKKFAGLRLGFIRTGSLFDRMKLKAGDIIKSVDGKKLTSMMDLLPYYNKLNDTTTVQIGFERDGKTKEIVYEIN
jgi:type II secretion system protein C